MKKRPSRVLSLLSALSLFLTLLPAASVGTSAKSYITDRTQTDGWCYTSDAALAQKLESVFAGNIGLYADSACTVSASAPLGSAVMTGSNRYYVKSNTTGSVTYGWQCYIYANGVYNTLFNEWVGHGAPFAHSVILLGGGISTVSCALFRTAGVRVGAYIRTTTDSTGAFLGSYGHSMIVLYYDEQTITVLEGNADGAGLVRITTCTWNEFNQGQLSGRGRYLCHIVQPTAEYYASLYPNAESFSDTFSVTYDLDGGVMTPSVKTVFTASGINQTRRTDQLVVYTSLYGATTGTNKYGEEIVVDRTGLVTAVPGYGIGGSAIPEGGFVLSAHGEARTLIAGIVAGDYVARAPGSLTLTVYADKESCLIGAKTVTAGEVYGELPTPSKKGYYFLGWTDGENPVTPDTVFTGTGTAALKACYASVTDSLTYLLTVSGTPDTENGLLYNIPPETTVGALTAAVCLTADLSCEVRGADGTALPTDAAAATGDTLCLISNGEISDTATLSVKGDIDGDGTVSVNDARIALRASADLYDFGSDKAALMAADVLGDGKAGIDDAKKILRVAAQIDVF